MPATFVASSKLPTAFGEFAMHGFEDSDSGQEHIALVFGDLTQNTPTLCRVHSECLTGDALFSMRCDCGPQLEHAMRKSARTEAVLFCICVKKGEGLAWSTK